MRVVATAGHVDHGKSTLVFALTGTDPDRLAEEKARGLTIDLGFAFATLSSGQVVGFVDVPGHVRFVKNMLAGVGAVDVALLVVAANEGWMPQTREHVEILDLLEIRHGVVALTKADTVDDETLELAHLEIAERLDASPLSKWPVVVVDGVSGRGLDALRAALEAAISTAPSPRDTERPRLWVDRAFSARGSGTVVTGTLTDGSLAVDDEVVVHPGAHAARVRKIESRNEQLARAAPGSRVALNLAGIARDEVQRGSAVVRPAQWVTPAVVDALVRVVGASELPARGAVDVHIGSGEHTGVLAVIDRGGGFARISLPVALPLAPGDRMVLRSSARRETVAGAEIVDVAPTRRTRDAPARLARPLIARVLDARGWTTADELTPLTGVVASRVDELVDEACTRGEAVRVGGWLVGPAELARVRDEVVAATHAPGATHGAELASLASGAGIDNARLRAALAGEARVVVERDVVRRADAAAVTEDPHARAVVDAFVARPFAPPDPAAVGASPALVRALVRSGELVDIDGVYFACVAYEQAARLIAQEVVARGALTVSDVRDLIGSSRKYIVPLLGKLDAEGITRRRGDVRIPGARVETFAPGEPRRSP